MCWFIAGFFKLKVNICIFKHLFSNSERLDKPYINIQISVYIVHVISVSVCLFWIIELSAPYCIIGINIYDDHAILSMNALPVHNKIVKMVLTLITWIQNTELFHNSLLQISGVLFGVALYLILKKAWQV